jgi:hypothetical protein
VVPTSALVAFIGERIVYFDFSEGRDRPIPNVRGFILLFAAAFK